MNKAVFFDRDGVINEEHGFTFRMEDFLVLPDVYEMMQHWQAKGYLLIVVSNQSGVAKKLYTSDDIKILHDYLKNELESRKIKVDEIYYCIHHPDVSRCICRKPDSLFIEKALSRFDIDPSRSFFIGDKARDVEAAEKAGVKGILITANSPLKNLIKDIT